jgi:ATP-binding cassette subfamily B multidrug efflux pump
VKSWVGDLKRAVSRTRQADRLNGQGEVGSKGPLKENLRLLKPYAMRRWKQGAAGAALIVGTSLLTYPQPLITRYFIDDVIMVRRIDRVLLVAAAFAALKLFGMAASAVQQYVMTRFEQDVIVELQSDLVARTLTLPKAFFDEKETGYLLSRVDSDVQGLRWFFSGTLVHLATQVLKFVGGVGFLFYLEWRLALVVLVLLPALPFVAAYFGRLFRVLSLHGMEKHARLSKRLEETLTASTLVKTFGTEERESARVASELEGIREVAMEQSVLSTVAGIALNALPDVSRAVVFVVGAYLVIKGSWTLGSLVAFQNYLGYVFGPAIAMASMNMELQGTLAALERVGSLFRVVPEAMTTGVKAERLAGAVELANVSFAYGGGEPMLEDVSVKVAPGEVVAVVGPSGVGKTTLVSLLLRLYNPTKGELLFDGRPASQYELASLRGRIGYVSQSVLLLSGTVLENLRYGRPEASLDQVVAAAKAAEIHDFVAGLPEGYESLVGERGVNLSEGQKQRVSLARALLKDPDILILDEPTSALDGVVERTILDALPAWIRGKTCFVVSHQLATVERADRVLLLRDRRVVADATHRELLASEPFYRELVHGAPEAPVPR